MGCELRVGSARFLKIPLQVCLQGSAKVPRGSARFRRVPQGSAMVLLRISLAGRVPRGSTRFRKDSAKVPQRFRKGSAMVFLRISFAEKVPRGSAKVAGCELRVGSARFREVPRRFRNGFLKDFPCWEGSARFREGSARFREGSARFRKGSARFRNGFLQDFPC